MKNLTLMKTMSIWLRLDLVPFQSIMRNVWTLYEEYGKESKDINGV